MVFQLDTTQAVTIGSEAGVPLATGGTYAGAGVDVVNASPVAVTAGVTYALVAPVAVGAVGDTVAWKMDMVSGADVWTETDGHGKDGLQRSVDDITGAGVSVREWTPRLTGNATFSIIRTGNPVIAAPWIAPHEGALIVAGKPRGARVEIASDGLHAYDETGTRTAHIDGGEGVFVGGEFRTSDALPGQVVLADDAVDNDLNGGTFGPGIRVTPTDTSDMVYPASIGPSARGLNIYGGKRTTGGRSIVQCNPDASFLRTFREDASRGGEVQSSSESSLLRTYRSDGKPGGVVQTTTEVSFLRNYREDGTAGGEVQTSSNDSRMRTYSGNASESGYVRVRPQEVELAYVAPDNTYFSQIRADANEAFLFTTAGGANRYLSVDANGVWVKTNKSGSWQVYNLEETAQDSGWVNLSPESGFTALSGYGLRYRNKGGVIFFDGVAVPTSAMTGSWQTIASIPAEARPDKQQLRKAVSSTMDANLRVTETGALQVYFLSGTATSQVHISPMFHVAH